MKNKIFHFDEKAYKHEDKKLTDGKIELQKIADAYSKIKGLPELTNADFADLFNDPTGFIGKAMIKHHNISIGGASIKPEKVFDLVAEPDGMPEFISAHKAAKQAFTNYYFYTGSSKTNTVCLDLEDYELNDKTISIKEEVLNCHKEKCSHYLKTDRQVEAHNALVMVQDGLNKLRDLSDGSLDVKGLLRDGLGVDIVNMINAPKMEYKINPTYIIEFERLK